MDVKRDVAIMFAVATGAYTLIELGWRGRTHWSMPLTAGTSCALIHIMNKDHGKGRNMLEKCLMAGTLITMSELMVGLVVNRALKLDVWDYTSVKGNFMGQICPQFFVAWCLLSIPVLMLSDILADKW